MGWIGQASRGFEDLDRCAGFADVRVQLVDDDCRSRIGGDRDEGCRVCLLGD